MKHYITTLVLTFVGICASAATASPAVPALATPTPSNSAAATSAPDTASAPAAAIPLAATLATPATHYLSASNPAPQEDASAANIKEEREFFAANKKVKGVKCSPSGLQYIIENKGKGQKPVDEDEVYVKYCGHFVDGTVFDQSLLKPAIFQMRALIPGMVEGLKMLGIGGKATLYIPSRLAYGKNAPENIGPDRMLIFEVELLDIYNEYE